MVCGLLDMSVDASAVGDGKYTPVSVVVDQSLRWK
jgi:hypothetical protein